MPRRRISRGTPAMLTTDEQKAWINTLDHDSEMKEAIETLLGVHLADLTFGEKLIAISSYMESGRANATFAQAARSRRDVLNLAAEKRGDFALADKVELQQATIERLEEQIARIQDAAGAAQREGKS